MAQYSAEILWQRGEQDFLGNRYSRRHVMRFDGGAEVVGSSSPHVVPVPMSDAAAIDPEEAFVASLSSCHMLWFLAIAAKRKFCVDRYADAAVVGSAIVNEIEQAQSAKDAVARVGRFARELIS